MEVWLRSTLYCVAPGMEFHDIATSFAVTVADGAGAGRGGKAVVATRKTVEVGEQVVAEEHAETL